MKNDKEPKDQSIRRKVVIHSRQGLHARPAALFVQIASRFKSDIRVKKGKEEVDGKSIMGLLTLAASRGTSIEVTAQGPDAEDALRALAQLVDCREVPAIVNVVKHRPGHAS
ncbi:MAG: HPr family phosphocarrier protein [Candidatus Omnitrophica bacterium]|nr:HPr family phosphocarrier protein [Candidatus Omnitrophota bacterium]